MSCAQSAIIRGICQVHENTETNMYCNTCNEQMCTRCVKEKHRSHDWETLDNQVKQKCVKLLSKCDKAKTQSIPEIREYIQNLKSAKTRVSEEKNATILKIHAQKQRIISVIESNAEKMTSLIENEHQEIIKELDAMITNYVNRLDNIEELVDEVGQHVTPFTYQCKKEFVQKLDTTLNELKYPEIDKLINVSQFVEGNATAAILESIFGHIHHGDMKNRLSVVLTSSMVQPKVTLTKLTSFRYKDTQILAISPVSESTAWIHRSLGEGSALLTLQGEEIQKLDIGMRFSHHIVTDDGSLIFAQFQGSAIYTVSTTEPARKIIDTSPLHPYSLCMSQCGDILVGMAENTSFDINKNSRRIIQRISMISSEVKMTYEYDKEKNTRLFKTPFRLHQNYNTDICVVDRTGIGTGQLYILRQDGGVKSIYMGHKLPKPMYPCDVVCDPNCNILLSDAGNNTIHMLQSNGEFIMLLTTKTSVNSPLSLALYDEYLWVGSHDGKVKIFKYVF